MTSISSIVRINTDNPLDCLNRTWRYNDVDDWWKALAKNSSLGDEFNDWQTYGSRDGKINYISNVVRSTEYTDEIRIQAIKMLKDLDELVVTDVLNDVGGVFERTHSFSQADFIKALILNNFFDVPSAFEIMKMINKVFPKNNLKYFMWCLNNSKKNYPILIYTNILFFVLKKKMNLELIDFIFERSQDNFIYKTAVEWQKKKMSQEPIDYIYDKLFYITKTYKVLCAQYLFKHTDDVEKYEAELKNFIKVNLETKPSNFDWYNTTADVADFLLQMPTTKKNTRDYCLKVIQELSRETGKVHASLIGAQNCHVIEAGPILNFINSLNVIPSKIVVENGYERTFGFNDAVNEFKSYDVYTENKEIIDISLFRLEMDSTIYPGGLKLNGIFVKIWLKINNEEELIKRLAEELTEMSRTCGTGHLNRLVNVFSGFDDSNFITISWKTQIESNIVGRFNKLIREIPDDLTIENKSIEIEEDLMYMLTNKEKESLAYRNKKDLLLKEVILEELSDSGSDYKPHLNDFIKKHSRVIEREMWQEFSGHISRDQFDEYFKSGVTNYFVGNSDHVKLSGVYAGNNNWTSDYTEYEPVGASNYNNLTMTDDQSSNDMYQYYKQARHTGIY